MAYVEFVAALKGRVYHAVRTPDAIITVTRCGRENLPPLGLDQIRRKRLRRCRTCFVTTADRF